MLKTLFLISLCIYADVSGAVNRFMATTGADVGDCSVNPCLTLQYTVNQSVALDVINIASGTYTDPVQPVNINKTLTILGAQANVDARFPRGAESILSNQQGISVSASQVIFNGLTIQDSSVAAFTGYGIWLNPGVDGTHIINNIFQNNIAGLGLSNAGTTQALIQHNLFQNNNLAGGAQGTGIYTDEFVSGAVSNVLINENNFLNNNNAGIGFSSSDLTKPSVNITITNNLINMNGRGIYFLNTQNANVTDNIITNLTVPTDGGSSAGISAFGAVSGLSILRNNIETGPRYGVRIGNFLSSNNSNILVHLNNIFGFAVAGMHVDQAPDGPVDYATCNWWGSASGPTNPQNPSGTGDVVEGDVVLANFDPWLIGLAPDSPCGVQPPTLAKIFSPALIDIGGTSTLTITLSNSNNMQADITTLVDNLPSGVQVSGISSTTCGGTVTAIIGSSLVTLTGGVIPAQSSCVVSVEVRSFNNGASLNTLPAGALQTDLGPNTDPASATLTTFVLAPMLSKNFKPSSICKGDTVLLTITLSNSNNVAANLSAPLVDNLPAHVKVNGDPITTCGGVVTAPIGSSTVTLSGGSIPAHGSCTVKVKVRASHKKAVINILPSGALQTDLGNNANPASASLFVKKCEDDEDHDRGAGVTSGAPFGPFFPAPAILPAPVPGAVLELPLALAPPADPASLLPKEPSSEMSTSAAINSIAKGHNEQESSGCSTVQQFDPAISLLLVAYLWFRFRIKRRAFKF
jgi:uncharacterized repeat protein (TIGR01451 family)